MEGSMKSPSVIHHGGADGVTGSCHRLMASERHHILVDCGIFQGEDAGRDSLAQHQVQFDLDRVRALVVTHVHIDHVGRLPYLLAAGFSGPILCTLPSAVLLPLVIEDALKVGFTRNARLIAQVQAQLQRQIVAVPYNGWYSVVDAPDLSLRVRFQRAGHILGSAYVEAEAGYREEPSVKSHRTVFSGDLGAPNAPLLPAPKSPYRADTLVIESTYGNRVHEDRRTRKARLRQAIELAMQNRGTVLIPAFSIGRTQEILYELEGLIAGNATAWGDLEIIVDSPLAARFTETYRQLKPFWDDEAQKRLRAGRHPLSFEQLYTVDSHQEHLQTVEYLTKSRRPAVVIAASGMVAGGRIMNYMKAMLGDPAHAVVFVGYQAKGTPGWTIQRYGRPLGEHLNPVDGPEPWVEMDGQRYTIRAGVTSIGGYSAHAGQDDLVKFVKRMKRWPKQIRVVHGNDAGREGLRAELLALGEKHGHEFEVVLPGAE